MKYHAKYQYNNSDIQAKTATVKTDNMMQKKGGITSSILYYDFVENCAEGCP